MCTAISYKGKESYFGRNLDLEYGYSESVVITPRAYEIKLRWKEPIVSHYAMIGMATVVDNVPLYYEATNERGVSMAGLHFPENAVYHPYVKGKDNVAPFELIPWILAQCANIDEVKRLLCRLNLVKEAFSRQLPLSPLHWMVSDKERSLTVESVGDGLKIYENPFGILTNNPPFPFHQINVSHYMALHTGEALSHFDTSIPMRNYSGGMGALGLPGDFSSASRFVRALFVKENSVISEDEEESVHQFFHILQSVAMPKGCVKTKAGAAYTRYSSCCNVEKGIYYYTTYYRLAISAVRMDSVDLTQSRLYTHKVDGL